MGNGRPARRRAQKKSLAQRTKQAEASAQQAGAGLLNMRMMYEQAVQEKLAAQSQLGAMQSLLAAVAAQYGTLGELEIDARTIQEIDSGEYSGFDWYKDDGDNIIIELYPAEEEDEVEEDVDSE